MRLGTVIFDFDGTLVDSYTERKFAHMEVCRFLLSYIRKESESDKKKMLELISNIEKEMTNRRIYNRNIWWAEVLNRYIGKPIQIPSKVLNDASFIYWDTVDERSFVYPGVENLLPVLKQNRILLGLISDTDGLKGMKSKRITDSGLNEYFDAVVIAGEDTEEIKPHKQPFIEIAKLLGVSPEKCIFIGDNPKVDVLGAKELGMKTIILGDNSNLFGESNIYPDFFIKRENIDNLEELIVLLLKNKSIERNDMGGEKWIQV